MIPSCSAFPYDTWRAPRAPVLHAFVLTALRSVGCAILAVSPEDELPLRLTVQRPGGERLGLLVYLFPVRPRRVRPGWQFVVSKGTRRRHEVELYQDPAGLYTTLLCGIDARRGLFVGADPVLHSPAVLPALIDFDTEDARQAIRMGWYPFVREAVGPEGLDEPVEVLVAGTAHHFLRYALFEREVLGEDAGHRELIAERFAPIRCRDAPPVVTPGS